MKKSIGIRFVASRKILGITSIWLSSIILVLLINPMMTEAQYVAWCNIPWMNWIRLGAAFLLTSFLPGYGLLTIFSREERWSLLEKGVLSILLSLFMTAFLSFVTYLLRGFIGSQSLIWLLFLNAFLLFFTYIRIAGSAIQREIPKENSSRLLSYTLLVALVSLIIISAYLCSFPDKFVPAFDQWVYYGRALRTLSGTSFYSLQSFYWSHMYGGLFIVTSGLPPANAYMTLIFIQCLIPMACFYMMCRAFFSRNASTVATLVLSLFFGFGGLYVAYLTWTTNEGLLQTIQYAALKTYDLWYIHQPFSCFYFPKLIGFSALFTLLYLIQRRCAREWVKVVIMSVVFALGFLWHLSEMTFFILTMPLILIFCKDRLADPKELPILVTFGLLIVGLVDLLSPQETYLVSRAFTAQVSPRPFTPFLIAITAVSYIISHVDIAGFFRKGFPKRKVVTIASTFTVVAFYISALGLIVWLHLLPDLWTPSMKGTVPWYLYPVRMGVGWFLAIASIPLLIRQERFGAFKIPLVIIASSIFIGRVSTLFIKMNLPYSFMPEYRILEFGWVAIAILAAVPLMQLLRSFKEGRTLRKVALAMTLTAIIIASVPSTLLSVYHYSEAPVAMSASELEAMDFLRLSTSPDATLAVLGSSNRMVESFSGCLAMTSYYEEAAFGVKSPEAFFNFLRYNMHNGLGHPIRYLLLRKADAHQLEKYKDSFILSHLIDYIPLIFKNDEVEVYEVPTFAPSSRCGGVAVIKPLESETGQIFALEALSRAQVSYRSYLEVAQKSIGDFTFFLEDPLEPMAMDPKETSDEEVIVIFHSASTPGHFASILSIESTSWNITADGLMGPGGGVETAPLIVPMSFSVRDDVEPIAFYTFRGNPIAPYAFRGEIGRREIVYVEAYPYFEAMEREAGKEAGRRMFVNLGELVDVLGLSLPRYEPVDHSFGLAVSYGETILSGNLTLESDSFCVPGFTLVSSPLVQPIKVYSDVCLSGANEAFLNGQKTQNKDFTHVEVVNLRLPDGFNAMFDGSEVEISPPGLGFYSKVLFNNGFNLTIQLPRENWANLTLNASGETLTLSVRGGDLLISIQSLVEGFPVYMSSVDVEADGLTSFERAFISWPYGLYVPNLPVEFRGSVRFTVNAMDKSFTLISNLEVEGEYTIFHEKLLQWDEWDIPWKAVLTSPYHLLLVIFTIVGSAWYYTRRRYRIKVRIKRKRENLKEVKDRSPSL